MITMSPTKISTMTEEQREWLDSTPYFECRSITVEGVTYTIDRRPAPQPGTFGFTPSLYGPHGTTIA